MAKEDISHRGRILSVTPEFTTVQIISSSACSSCHAAGFCALGESAEKIIELPTDPYGFFESGEEVEVVLKATAGLKAVWLAYVAPLALLMLTVLVMVKTGFGELTSALSALGAVVLWYFILWLFRKKLRNQYVFTLKKLSNK